MQHSTRLAAGRKGRALLPSLDIDLSSASDIDQRPCPTDTNRQHSNRLAAGRKGRALLPLFDIDYSSTSDADQPITNTQGNERPNVTYTIASSQSDIENNDPQSEYLISVPVAPWLICNICKAQTTYKTHNDLLRHLKTRHNGSIILKFKCNKCNKIFPAIKNCNVHQKLPPCNQAKADSPILPPTNVTQRRRGRTNRAKTPPQQIDRSCSNCGSAQTTQWRKDDNNDNYCNACWLYEQRTGVKRKASHLHKGRRSSQLANQPGTSKGAAKQRQRRHLHKSVEDLLEGVTLPRPSILLSPSPSPTNHRQRASTPEQTPPLNLSNHTIAATPNNPAGQNAIHSPVSSIHILTPPQAIDDRMAAQPNQAPPPPNSPTNKNTIRITPATQHQKEWTQRFDAVNTPQQLDQLLTELTEEMRKKAQEMNPALTEQQRPRQTRQPPRRRPNQQARYDPKAAAKIQKLYRKNRVRAMRQISNQASPFCTINKEILFDHFKEVFGNRNHHIEGLPNGLPELPPIPNENQDPLSPPFTPREVWTRLRRTNNTAPGPDSIRYAVLKHFDKSAHILTSIFNCVQRLHYIPTTWRESNTILIHKKGDKTDVSNWRPISLSNTIAKLHSAVLAGRLGTWSVQTGRITPAQKGFMPVDGCSEHNFVLQSILQESRRSKKEVAIAWLDLTNAFGSIPHETIFAALKWAGLNDNAINTIRLLYDGCQTTIKSTEGPTEPIQIESGVKQGCPLSPIIFNLAIEPMIKAALQNDNGFNLGTKKYSILAYADDLVLTAKTANDLRQLLEKTTEIANWAGLRFNPKKCATLHVNGHVNGKRHAEMETLFEIQDAIMPKISIKEYYEYLGIPTGYYTGPSPNSVIIQMREQIEAIDASLLAPWQKFDAVNTFVLPCICFHLKNAAVSKKSLKKIDQQLRDVGRRWLNLPPNSAADIFYLPYNQGGLGLVPLQHLDDISQAVHAYRLLHSHDLGNTSYQLLKDVVKKKLNRREPTPQFITDYLNGISTGALGGRSDDVESTWTRLRMAMRRLSKLMHLKFNVPAMDSPPILLLNDSPIKPQSCEYTLRCGLRDYFRRQLLDKPDQGKTFQVISHEPASNHFLQSGKYTRFADWRFIHRARLNVVPLNGARNRFVPGHNDKKCRRCGFNNETLPHVLCHCPPRLPAITRRHNAILDRLVKAYKPPATTTVHINKTIPGLNDNIRPDIVAIDEINKRATIIDVTTPFENNYAAFIEARHEKIRKYEPVVRHFEQLGFDSANIYLNAFIVGALGGWDPNNELVLSQLGIGAHYRVLMRRLMVSDCIKWSRDIYVEHMTGQKQYDD